jgi:hypothetical protein
VSAYSGSKKPFLLVMCSRFRLFIVLIGRFEKRMSMIAVASNKG